LLRNIYGNLNRLFGVYPIGLLTSAFCATKVNVVFHIRSLLLAVTLLLTVVIPFTEHKFQHTAILIMDLLLLYLFYLVNNIHEQTEVVCRFLIAFYHFKFLEIKSPKRFMFVIPGLSIVVWDIYCRYMFIPSNCDFYLAVIIGVSAVPLLLLLLWTFLILGYSIICM
jgi:hypothetical protein